MVSYHVEMSKYITSTQAAKLLGVTRRTLLRWEERKWLRSHRDEQGHRIYREDHVRWAKHVWDQWVSIRRHHREHLRKLPAIQREVERYIVVTSLERTKDKTPFDRGEMKEAFRKMKAWQEEARRTHEMYDQFLNSDVVEPLKLAVKGVEAGRIK